MATTLARVSEADAIEAVYREDGARLWRAVYAFAASPEVASDAVAESFAQALRRGPAVRNVRAWVWRSAFRLAAGDLKRQSSLVRGRMPDGAVVDPHPDEELLDALQGITPQQRAVIILHYYADCPVREIARRTGMNALAVRAHLSRGRKHLRLLLGDER